MLKIDVIRFEAQDVITTSLAGPEVEDQKGICYCNNDCTIDNLGFVVHAASHRYCTDCKFSNN